MDDSLIVGIGLWTAGCFAVGYFLGRYITTIMTEDFHDSDG